MYTKCIQNVNHLSISFCIHVVYKIKRTMPTKFCIQYVYKSLSKCGIHFVYKHFVYSLYTFYIQNVYKNLSKYGIHFVYKHFVYINSVLQKVYSINIMYTVYIQNSYRMYIQIIVCRMDPLFQHILTRLLCTS